MPDRVKERLKKDVKLNLKLFLAYIVIFAISAIVIKNTDHAVLLLMLLLFSLLLFGLYKLLDFIRFWIRVVKFEKEEKQLVAKKVEENRITAEKELQRIAEEKIKEQERRKQEAEKEIIEKKKDEKRKKLLLNPIFFDVETTGVNYEKDEIIQLSIIDKDGEILFNHLIKPEHKRQWKTAEEINGISYSMVKKEKTFDYYYNEIQDIFDSASVIVAYNTSFDIKFIRNAGIMYKRETMDLMLDYAKIAGDWDFDRREYRWKKLIQCARYYDYKWKKSEAHDSLNDVKATRFCFYKMIEKSGARSVEIRYQ